MEITVNTKLHPVLGKPLKQSLSSRMGNRMYEKLGLDYYRFPIEVDREDLGAVLNGLKRMNVDSFGVTKPYKVEILPYLDEIDELSLKIGAVNSVRVIDKKLYGRNIDGLAFVQALVEDTGCKLEETDFFCFGAGGAGRAICCTLAYCGARHITITDKFDSCAEDLVKKINEEFAPVADQVLYENKQELREAFGSCKVVMNVSGVGMYPHLGESPADKEWFRKSQIAFDATYNPARTQFLKDAEAAGCFVFNGKNMLIRCSMIGFEERLGVHPPYEEWSEIFDEVLKESAIS